MRHEDQAVELPASPFEPDARLRRRERIAYLRIVKLLAPPVRQPRATGRAPVLLVPGFLSGDWSMAPLGRFLRRRGNATFGSGFRFNAGCTEELVHRLERRLDAVATRTGRPVAIVGQSRGGTLARLVVTRRPELVAALVTLGSPIVDPLAAAPDVLRQIEWLVRVNRAGRPWLLTEDCVRGECATWVRRTLAEPFPPQVPYTAVYSRSDGIVDWRACLDPAAEHVEVHTSHNGMGSHRTTYRIIENRLAALDRS